MTLQAEPAVDHRVFEELLDAEVFLNPAKLHECTRQGVPPHYRSVVYRFLLGVSSTELTAERMQEEDYAELERASVESHKKWRAKQHSTYSPLLSTNRCWGTPPTAAAASSSSSSSAFPVVTDAGRWELSSTGRSRFQYAVLRDASPAERRKRFDSVLRVLQMTHAHQNLLPREVDWIVTIASTLEPLFTYPHEIFYCVEQLLMVIPIDGSAESRHRLQDRCGQFLCLFRALNEDLYAHFQAEEVRYDTWLPQVLATFLAANLDSPEDTLRLWDSYLADISECSDVPLHLFVVLAVLDEFTEELMELDRVGIASFLQRVPRINIEHILHTASGFRSEAISRELF
jgi:hypothetical protein